MPGSDIHIKAGSQRQLIRIMQPVAGPIGVSGSTTVLQLFAGPLPAEIAPASARDTIRSGQTVQQIAIPITIRYMDGVQANMQVQRVQSRQGVYYATATYVIRGIINVDERNWKLTLMCEALGANQ